MDRNQLKFIVGEARSHLAECLAAVLREEGWKESSSPEQIIDLHMEPERKRYRERREDILSGMLYSAQNKQDANRVIEGSVDTGWDGMRELLLGFDPQAILETWSDDKLLFRYFKDSGRVSGQMRDRPTSRWPQFCKSVLSASRFIERFATGAEFVAWVETFRKNPDTAAALPLILAEEIDGFGLALACDFLKELGFEEFPKPDVHIKNLAHQLGISSSTSDYMLLRDLMRLEPLLTPEKVSLYSFDKYLWLIGSGRFYLVKEGGVELRIGSQVEQFMERIRRTDVGSGITPRL